MRALGYVAGLAYVVIGVNVLLSSLLNEPVSPLVGIAVLFGMTMRGIHVADKGPGT